MPNRGGHQPDRPGQGQLASGGASIEMLIPPRIHGSRLTLCRRETDSNPRSPVKENQLTRAPRLTATGVSPRRSDTCACRPVAVAIRADTVVGGTRYIANLQCPRLSHY